MALLSEAHGLVTDLLLESATMSPQLASGLKALANLLSPPSLAATTGGGGARSRLALPHAALSDVHYASDTEEIPYTGETLLHLSKVQRSTVQFSMMTSLLMSLSASSIQRTAESSFFKKGSPI